METFLRKAQSLLAEKDFKSNDSGTIPTSIIGCDT